MDYSGFLEGRQEFATSGGCLEVPVFLARFPDALNEVPFDLPGTEDVGRAVLVLGDTPDEVKHRTGRNLEGVVTWDRLLTHRICLTDQGFIWEDIAGPDYLSIFVPTEAMVEDPADLPDDVTYRITLNGESVNVNARYLRQLADWMGADVKQEGDITDVEWANLAARFDATAWLHRAIPAFSLINEEVLGQFEFRPCPGRCR